MLYVQSALGRSCCCIYDTTVRSQHPQPASAPNKLRTKHSDRHLRGDSVSTTGSSERHTVPTISLWECRDRCCRCHPRSGDSMASRISLLVLCTDSRSEIPKPICTRVHRTPGTYQAAKHMQTSVVTVTVSFIFVLSFPFSPHFPSVLWHCSLDDRKGIQPVKTAGCWFVDDLTGALHVL